MIATESYPLILNASASRARRTGDAPTFALASGPVGETDLRHGRDLFSANCSSCHGSNGAGDGAGAVALLPRPANLQAHLYADGRVSAALWNGVTGSAMPAWRDRRAEDLRDVVAYVQSLSTKHQHLTSQAADESSQFDEARTLFAQNCASCHGDDGAGDGPAAAALNRAPTNFKIQQPSIDYARRVLIEGVAGSAMPPWEHQLTEAQRQQLVDYVRSLFDVSGHLGDERRAAAERRSQ